MSVALGIVAVLGVIMIGGGSALDEPLSDDVRLDLGLGFVATTIMLALIVGLLL